MKFCPMRVLSVGIENEHLNVQYEEAIVRIDSKDEYQMNKLNQ